jgi:hypothetical protein
MEGQNDKANIDASKMSNEHIRKIMPNEQVRVRNTCDWFSSANLHPSNFYKYSTFFTWPVIVQYWHRFSTLHQVFIPGHHYIGAEISAAWLIWRAFLQAKSGVLNLETGRAATVSTGRPHLQELLTELVFEGERASHIGVIASGEGYCRSPFAARDLCQRTV